MRASLLAKAKDVTGWSDDQLARVVGVSRQLVQKVIAGETPEYLTAPQTAALMAAVRLYVAQLRQGLEELEALR